MIRRQTPFPCQRSTWRHRRPTSREHANQCTVPFWVGTLLCLVRDAVIVKDNLDQVAGDPYGHPLNQAVTEPG
jgi:hypothetical protein